MQISTLIECTIKVVMSLIPMTMEGLSMLGQSGVKKELSTLEGVRKPYYVRKLEKSE